MRSLKKDHLIRAIATYKKGNDRYFLFPWAKGGNLQDMLEKDERKLDKDLINWIVCQIVGLSEGIAALHANNIRHGDIKPSNILCDGPDLGASNKSILLIADVGLAKKHEEYTRYRPKITTTRHGSITYEPPEVSPKKELGRLSRKYDVWSLGCVFLELIIWAVYGTNGIKTFHKELNKNATPQFWKDRKVHSGEKVHSIVKKRFKDLKKDLKNLPALAHLVEFIEEKLLKVSVDERPYSTAVYDKLKTIKQDIDNIPEDRFNAELTKLVPKRETPAPAESTNAGTNLATQVSYSIFPALVYNN
ncbi:hypothetical protein TRIATDRAFT_253341 [Trichoderma atroviride IMI 206040]|uniref:Protein kinase domain-containing protein n=1 Tax=Hypocrea atroviridis (strain ATCC 20476 / IMI 206040) TaxID=452589 RepID=G9PC82_HYPAI|nr:uncharacterized protein TRIATDRAFT_253341 [Trichoderma atroviride IMI 206040]EHK39456.1 hypothetical protein TRIATDRAFT_253341 [Trichoderma atroviride IMI 206040]